MWRQRGAGPRSGNTAAKSNSNAESGEEKDGDEKAGGPRRRPEKTQDADEEAGGRTEKKTGEDNGQDAGLEG